MNTSLWIGHWADVGIEDEGKDGVSGNAMVFSHWDRPKEQEQEEICEEGK